MSPITLAGNALQSDQTTSAFHHRPEYKNDSRVGAFELVTIIGARDSQSSCLKEVTHRKTKSSKFNHPEMVRHRKYDHGSLLTSRLTSVIADMKPDIDRSSDPDAETCQTNCSLPVTAHSRIDTLSPPWWGQSSISNVWSWCSLNPHFECYVGCSAAGHVITGNGSRVSLVVGSSSTSFEKIAMINRKRKLVDLREHVTASFDASLRPEQTYRKRMTMTTSSRFDESLINKHNGRNGFPVQLSSSVAGGAGIFEDGDRKYQSVYRLRRYDIFKTDKRRQGALLGIQTCWRISYQMRGSEQISASDVINARIKSTAFNGSYQFNWFSIHSPTTSGVDRDDSHITAREHFPDTIPASGSGINSTESPSLVRHRVLIDDDQCSVSRRRSNRRCSVIAPPSAYDRRPRRVPGIRRRFQWRISSKSIPQTLNSWIMAAVMIQCVSFLICPVHCSSRRLQSSILSSAVSSISSTLSSSSASLSSSFPSSSASSGLSPTAGQQRQMVSRSYEHGGSGVSADVAIGLPGSVPVGGGVGSGVGRGGGRSPRSDSGSSLKMGDGPGLPCIYEGHIKTDRDWYGYIANISVRTTGQLGFEFVYPADRCCQNVLFYLDEQAAIIGPRMNCWQREYLLRPEADQILRLTPSFSWSGCHVVASADERVGDVFVCKGGRSFSVDVGDGGRLTTWQIAVSNCATLNGIELRYRLEVFGHVGECTGRRPEVPNNADVDMSPAVVAPGSVPRSSLTPREAATHHRGSKSATDEEERVCIVVGDVNTTYSWYGFLRNLSLEAGGGYRFMFTYPPSMQVQNVILYNDDDVHKLDWEQSCWQKEGVIASEKVFEQIINMQVQSTLSGCSVNETVNGPSGYRLPLPAPPTHGELDSADRGASAVDQPADDGALTGYYEAVSTAYSSNGANLTCLGEKRYDTPTKVFLALSNCRSNGRGLRLRYRLEVFGYAKDDLCARSSSSSPIYGVTSSIPSIFDLFINGCRRLFVQDHHDVSQLSLEGVSGDRLISKQRTLHIIRCIWRPIEVAIVTVVLAAGSIQLL